MWFGQRGFSQQSRPAAVLDVGSHKICCLIGSPQLSSAREDGLRLKLLGYASRQAEGVSGGQIADMNAAEMSIRRTIAEAEKMADLVVERVYVTSSAGQSGERLTAKVPLPSGVAEKDHIAQAVDAVRRDAASQGKVALHTHPMTFAIGAERGIRDPCGMAGDSLRVDLHSIFASTSPLSNLKLCLQRSHIEFAGFCIGGYASALSVLNASEANAGAVVIDMGADTTSIVALRGGRMVYADCIKSGGARITDDLADVFALTRSEAERLKTLHGGVMSGPEDEGGIIMLPISAKRGETWISLNKLEVSAVVRRRQEAVFVGLAERWQKAEGLSSQSQIILTGGASQLLGAAPLAERLFKAPVRIAAPPAFFKGPSPVIGPEFAAASGLLGHVHREDWSVDFSLSARSAQPESGYISRVGDWLWQGF